MLAQTHRMGQLEDVVAHQDIVMEQQIEFDLVDLPELEELPQVLLELALRPDPGVLPEGDRGVLFIRRSRLFLGLLHGHGGVELERGLHDVAAPRVGCAEMLDHHRGTSALGR